MKNISQANIRAFEVALPPIEEQARITGRANVLAKQLDNERGYRSKLQRLKTGLMQDLLTRRKRVPEIADQVAEAVA